MVMETVYLCLEHQYYLFMHDFLIWNFDAIGSTSSDIDHLMKIQVLKGLNGPQFPVNHNMGNLHG